MLVNPIPSLNKSVFLFTLIFLFQISAKAQMRQVFIDNSQSGNEIKKLSFYSAAEGYVAFRDWIGYTTDSGRTFQKKYITLSNVDYNGNSVNLTFGFGISGVKAFDQNTLIVYGDFGFIPAILYSTNGANTFKLIYHSQFNSSEIRTGITDMVFPQNGIIGYAVDADRILKTTNRGITWNVTRTDPGSYFDHLDAPDDNNVLAMSTGFTTNKLVKTTNGGGSWLPVTLPPLTKGKLRYASLLNANTGWLNMYDYDTYDSYFYKTVNGGSSWTLQNNIEATPFSSDKFKFLDDNVGYALTGQNEVSKTVNSGVLWEPLPRDNNYSYLNYSHNDLQCLNLTQFWAGGGHGFLELSTNGGGTPLPRSYFRIDTVGLSTSNIVNLPNYSKPGYTYRWFVNNVQISTAYNASYTHASSRTRDTVQLIVSNGVKSDTSVKYQNFFTPVIVTSFTPTSATSGTVVTINGTNLSGALNVTFGGAPAASFTVVSSTKISATVGAGATGAVTVTTPQGSGSLAGFIYFAAPAINLPTTVSDSILCKSESIIVTLQNTQPNVRYDLMDSLNNSFGFVNSGGGTASIYTSAISRTGNYKIKAARLNINSTSTFTKSIFIVVEHTRAQFSGNRINIMPGEKVSFFDRSIESLTRKWVFHEDASIGQSSDINPQELFYPSAGQKTLSIISTSLNGCADTLSTNAVYVYNKPSPDDVCYAQNVDDSDFAYSPQSPTIMSKVSLSKNNGYFISGLGNRPKLKSRYGIAKNLLSDGAAYFSKYTTDGVLSWSLSINNSGRFYGAEQDSIGNVYIIGSCKVLNYLTLVNGDSIRISATPTDVVSFSNKVNGFVLKLDSSGNYIWHTIIDDPSGEFQGYPVQGGLPSKIKIKGNQILIAGSFLANLGYCKNGVKQTLVTLPNNTYVNFLQNNFILKIRDDGSLVWNMYFENDAVNQKRDVAGIGVDNDKNVFVTGYYEGKVAIHDAGNVNNFSYTGATADSRSYLLKFDSSGHLVWKVNMINTFNFRDISTTDIVTDINGVSYLTGTSSLATSAEYFQITNSDGSLSNVSLAPYFLMKFDSRGVYKWGVGSKYASYGKGNSVYLKGGDLYTVGTLSNNGARINMTSSDGSEVSLPFYESEFFIAHYDTSGMLKKLGRSGQNIGGHLVPNKVVVDSNGNFIVSGLADNNNGGNSSFTAYSNVLNTNKIDGFFIKVNPDFCFSPVSPVANAGVDKVRCSGDTVSLGGTSIAGAYYNWSSYPAGFSSTSSNPLVSPSVTTTYYLTVINQAGLIGKDTVNITVNPSPVANAGADQTICEGTSTTIGVNAVSGIAYSWTSNPSGFTSTLSNPSVSPQTTTKYYLETRNGGSCVGKDTVVISIGTGVAPAVNITSTSSQVCEGENITFNATPVNGGTQPMYQWQVNGTNVGSNSPIFSTSLLMPGSNQVKVSLSSSLTCVTTPTATSNVIIVNVKPLTPTLNIGGNTTVTAGASTVITATVIYGTAAPLYQWGDSTETHGWSNIAGATNSSLTYFPTKTGNKVRCISFANISSCSNSQISNALTFTVNTVTAVNTVSASDYAIKLYPNPATKTVSIDSIKLSDHWQTCKIINMEAKQVKPLQNIIGRTKCILDVQGLPPGYYIAVLTNQKGNSAYLKFIKL
jgi:hypothetical protein